MLLALLLSIFLLSLYRIKINLHGFNDDYLSKDSTNSIKGIFILLIVISHSLNMIMKGKYTFAGFGDVRFQSFFYYLSQLVVVMFLFYSGYGVGESFRNKGKEYVNAMPRHRILGVLLNFDVAVVIYLVVALLLGSILTFSKIALSLIAWESLGNDHWYIFVILLCYLMTFVTLRLPIEKSFHWVFVLFVLCVACAFVLSLYKQYHWYNTILCYPLGFMYSFYKEKIESHLKSYYWIDVILLVVIFVPLYLLFHDCPFDRFQIGYNVMSMLFALLIILLTFKVRFDNGLLCWAGTHLFPIFIYMRLPMIVMQHKMPVLLDAYPVLFILLSLVLTLFIASAFKFWKIRI